MRTTARSTVLTAILLLASLAVSLLTAELLVRLFRPQPRMVISPSGLYVPDPPGRHRLADGYRGRIYNRTEFSTEIRINALGLRGPELLTESPERIQILALGDSFTFGVGVEDSETFVAALADQLTRQGAAAEGLNGGIPDFGVQDAQSWFQRHGLRLEPDVVVLGIFLGNDLADASPERENALIVDGLLTPSESPSGAKAWLHRHSHLFLLAKSFLDKPGLLPLRSRLGLGEPWAVRTLKKELAVYLRASSERLRQAIGITDQALGRLAASTRHRDIQLVALLIPGEIQLDPDRWRSTLSTLQLAAVEYDPQRPTGIFVQLLSKHSIPTIDATPFLTMGLRRGEQLYYRHDRHWTPAAHVLAATELARFLLPRIREPLPATHEVDH